MVNLNENTAGRPEESFLKKPKAYKLSIKSHFPLNINFHETISKMILMFL